jgi:HD-like signal output (HDOD) protein
MVQITLDKILEQAREIPPISDVALRLLKIISNPDVSREEVAKLLEIDEVLFGNAFRLANSAAIGSRRELKSAQEIIDVLGMKELSKIVTIVATKDALKDPELFYQSVFLANGAQKFARDLKLSKEYSDSVYIAALFLSFGSLVFKTFYQDEYIKILETNDFVERVLLEEREFGISNTELTYKILLDWDLPAEVTEIVKLQCDPSSHRFSVPNALIEFSRIALTLKNATNKEIEETFSDNKIIAVINKFNLHSLKLDSEIVRELHEQAKAIINA